MKKILAVFLSLATYAGLAQRTPVDIAKQLLSTKKSIDTTGLYSNELDLRPRGMALLFLPNSSGNARPEFTKLKAQYQFSYRTFAIDADYQIINVTAIDSLEKGFDFYLHFKRTASNWQLADAVRLKRAVVAELWMATLPMNKVDSIINSDDPQKIIQSKEQFDYIKNLFELSMGFDDAIVAYFNENKTSFHTLKRDFHQAKPGNKRMSGVEGQALSALNKNDLLITEIIEYGQALDNLLAFYIRRTHHGNLGYMYIQDESRVSELIEFGRIFFIREIGNGWYMFKGRGK